MTTVPVPRGFLARNGWPLAIASVLLLGAGFNFAIMYVAQRDPAFAIEPDYYGRAVRWDDEMAQERTNQRLNWMAVGSLTLGSSADETGRLVVQLRDSAGAALTGARVEAETMHNARAGQRVTIALAEVAPGTYAAGLDARRPGEWEVRLVVERAGERFTQRLRLTAVTP